MSASARLLAVVFPGIGYTPDKPLLYYGAKLAARCGYEVVRITYGGFERDIRGNQQKMADAFASAVEQAGKQLAPLALTAEDDIVFLSKSVGTGVSLLYAKEHGLRPRSVLYTPLLSTFTLPCGDAIAFHGTADPWAPDNDAIATAALGQGVPFYTVADANHSLETGDVERDLTTLSDVMRKTQAFLTGEASL